MNAIFAQTLSLLAAWKPEYWHVMAFAWMEVSHCLNLAITFAFWFILVPVLWPMIPEGFPSTNFDWLIIVHMTVVHITPLVMIWVNIYFTDIKMLSADWKLMVWHGLFYAFANWLGQFDHDVPIYPMTDWVNAPGMVIGFFIVGIPSMIGFWLCYCNYANQKRRGEI